MPTELPDRIARSSADDPAQKRRSFGEAAFIAATLLYLLLLAWNIASLAAVIDEAFERDRSPSAYNPMEPSGPHWRISARGQ
jgi:hypothetical protein